MSYRLFLVPVVLVLVLLFAATAVNAQPCVATSHATWYWYTPSDEPPPAPLTFASTLGGDTGIESTRERIITKLWGRRGMPRALPTRVDLAEPTVLRNPPANIARTEKLTIDLGIMEAYAYVFTPKQPNGKLMLYHAGHETAHEIAMMLESTKPIEDFISAGYTVAALGMPMSGINRESRPLAHIPGAGDVRLRLHDQFRYLTGGVSPLRYFLEPAIITLNHLLGKGSYSTVGMMGFSGGGWTITLLAAIDPRIQRSYPVAGSLPMYLRFFEDRNFGDYEQTLPAFYDDVDYLDLYVLGASGSGRRQVQTLIKYDVCCFALEQRPAYVDAVHSAVHHAGDGSFDFWLDDTVIGHELSPCTASRILMDMDR